MHIPFFHKKKAATPLEQEASSYLQLYHHERGGMNNFSSRHAQILDEIAHTKTYWQTTQELAYGAKIAWRNNTRCIGRLHWETLAVHDMRHLTTAEQVFESLVEHLRLASNCGKIRSTITIFAPPLPGQPGIRIWNPQLIRYAGYPQPDGSIIGDPAHTTLTSLAQRLGWQGGAGTPFDVLPLIIQVPPAPPQLFELPRDSILEVPLSHPDFPWFADLGLKWHAVPVISNMRLEIGGISYTAAPFNGWYMGTEIGARNLGDTDRYNLLPIIAKKMALATHSDRTLWKDRALIELNVAVLTSFARHGVTIVDHHTASRQFLLHDSLEQQQRRTVPGHWVWLVPPVSGSTCPIFHIHTYKNTILKPNFFYQQPAWQDPRTIC